MECLIADIWGFYGSKGSDIDLGLYHTM